jgi:hypothetical protein
MLFIGAGMSKVFGIKTMPDQIRNIEADSNPHPNNSEGAEASTAISWTKMIR